MLYFLNLHPTHTYIICGIQMTYLTKQPFEIQANCNSLVCLLCQAHSRKCTEPISLQWRCTWQLHPRNLPNSWLICQKRLSREKWLGWFYQCNFGRCSKKWRLNVLKIEHFGDWIFWRLNILKTEHFEDWTFWRLIILKIEHLEGWNAQFEDWTFLARQSCTLNSKG